MGRKYKNPPVVEAVCEFRLSQDTPWDLTIPGLFYERVKDDFPHREQRVISDVELTREPHGLHQRTVTSERILLFSKDRKRIIQLGPRLLVINVLKPYPTWQGFKPIIEKSWNHLLEIVEVRGVDRIGLRYINQIDPPSDTIELEEYFEFYPHIGKRLPQTLASFIVGAEFSYDEERDKCKVQLAPAIVHREKSALILDIDYFLARPQSIDISMVMDWIEKAHSRVEEIFEGCITDKLRKMFEEVS